MVTMPIASADYFNPRTPCGVRLQRAGFLRIHTKFQSTHPVWGATDGGCAHHLGNTISIHAPRVGCDQPRSGSPLLSSGDFNPRTPCGVRHAHQAAVPRYSPFQSTHSVWGATTSMLTDLPPYTFQSTHPVWGATGPGCSYPGPSHISIHAPRVGCDLTSKCSSSSSRVFQSTHPVWGATAVYLNDNKAFIISIHAPRVGCDSI